jgi:hypothetical protein
MNAVSRLFALGMTAGALLAATSLPAAAQGLPGAGACTIAPDAVVSQALGPSAHSVGGPSGLGLDFCNISVGSESISVLHMAAGAAPSPTDAQTMAAQLTGAVGSAPVTAAAAFTVQSTPVSGIGDNAVLMLMQQPGVGTMQSLVVQRGGDTFSFNTIDSSDAVAQLTALATAVLANLGN